MRQPTKGKIMTKKNKGKSAPRSVLSVYLEPDLKKWTEEAAKARNRTASNYVESLIKNEQSKVSEQK